MKGADAEDRALGELLRQGHTLLARNYRIPGGEIDLITQDPNNTIVFSEVRQRRSAHYGGASYSVTPRKLGLFQRAALSYLVREHGRDDLPCRLQLVAIEGAASSGALSIHPIEP